MCYVDDVMLTAENKNVLLRLVYNFNKAWRYNEYNMKIAAEKTKSITISHANALLVAWHSHIGLFPKMWLELCHHYF